MKIDPSTEWPMALSYNPVNYSEKYLPSLADLETLQRGN